MAADFRPYSQAQLDDDGTIAELVDSETRDPIFELPGDLDCKVAIT